MEPAARRDPRLTDLEPEASDFRAEVLQGLSARPRTLPCKYFYDAEGSRLFDRITELDDYYPTRAEVSILRDNMGEIVDKLEDDVLLVEFGSGSSTKTRLLLDHLPRAAGYVPVDISREHLLEAARSLAQRYPHLEILPVCADFTQPIELPRPRRTPGHRVVFFPGSTIGNFTRDEAHSFLETVTEDCGPGGGLLIGVDLRKDPRILERAYDDSEGVTAAFNLNLLERINRELGGDFDVQAFRHRAVWNEERGRVEMHLESTRNQVVTIGGTTLRFDAGESIHTESSHKYGVEEFAALAARAGFRQDTVWTDPDRLFSVHLYWVDAS